MSEDESLNKEMLIINKIGLQNLKNLTHGGEGYKLKNLTNGGDGGIMSIPGVVEKIRKANVGKKEVKNLKRK